MQNKLKELFRDKELYPSNFGTVNEAPEIYIIDKKNEKKGNICVQSYKDDQVQGVRLNNKPLLDVFYYIFAEYSLKKEILDSSGNFVQFEPLDSKSSYRHCECMLFPDLDDTDNSWILLVETKYARDYGAASKKINDYPHNMIEQIISTAEYLRRHGVIPRGRMIDAIVSFPNVLINFRSSLFRGHIYTENENKIDKSKPKTANKMTMSQIVRKYNIRIIAQNSATIKNELKLSYS